MDKIKVIQKPHKKKLSLHKRRRITIVLIILLIILLAVIGSSLCILNSNSDNTKLSQTELVRKVNELNNKSKSKEARKLIESQTQVKYSDDAEVAVIYAQSLAADGDSDKAVAILDDLRQGAASNQEYDYVGKAAYILQLDGQKDKAIEYYKEALALVRAQNPADDQEQLAVGTAIADYMWHLDQLGANNE